MSSLMTYDTPGRLHTCPGSFSRSLIFDDFGGFLLFSGVDDEITTYLGQMSFLNDCESNEESRVVQKQIMTTSDVDT